jgi:hypothetical protein
MSYYDTNYYFNKYYSFPQSLQGMYTLYPKNYQYMTYPTTSLQYSTNLADLSNLYNLYKSSNPDDAPKTEVMTVDSNINKTIYVSTDNPESNKTDTASSLVEFSKPIPTIVKPLSRFQELVEEILKTNKCPAKMGVEISKLKLTEDDYNWLEDYYKKTSNQFIKGWLAYELGCFHSYSLGHFIGMFGVIDKAFSYFQVSSDLGNYRGMTMLGLFYINGYGSTNVDNKKGMELQIKAAEIAEKEVGGDHQCAWNAAYCYKNIEEDNDKNKEKYYLWLKQATELGSRLALEEITEMIKINEEEEDEN